MEQTMAPTETYLEYAAVQVGAVHENATFRRNQDDFPHGRVGTTVWVAQDVPVMVHETTGVV